MMSIKVSRRLSSFSFIARKYLISLRIISTIFPSSPYLSSNGVHISLILSLILRTNLFALSGNAFRNAYETVGSSTMTEETCFSKSFLNCGQSLQLPLKWGTFSSTCVSTRFASTASPPPHSVSHGREFDSWYKITR